MQSTLLTAPDIASAERAVAAANAQIGIQRSGYPELFAQRHGRLPPAPHVPNLFSASAACGRSACRWRRQGVRSRDRSRVEGAEAARNAAVARYRQTALSAFQGVEDQLSASAALSQQEGLRRKASQAADLTEQQQLNRYRAGQASYTDVVTAQESALNARRNVVQLESSRQASAIALIQALGGGWHPGRRIGHPLRQVRRVHLACADEHCAMYRNTLGSATGHSPRIVAHGRR